MHHNALALLIAQIDFGDRHGSALGGPALPQQKDGLPAIMVEHEQANWS
jgi:hypothetical protein